MRPQPFLACLLACPLLFAGMAPGDVVEIPANTLHWHGAAPFSSFAHLGITPHARENRTTWGAPVTDGEYAEATSR